MRNIIAAVFRAIANAIRAIWKTVVRAGRTTMEWVQETALPASWDFACDVVDAGARTVRHGLHAVPNLLSRLNGGGTVAPSPTSNAAASISRQQESRQAQRQQAVAEVNWTEVALATRAAVRAMVRGELPQGVPASVARWLTETITPDKRVTLAALPIGTVICVLHGEKVEGVYEYDREAQ